jgi:hypothetical protein
VSQEWLGLALTLSGQREQALELYKQSLAIKERLAKANPRSAIAQRDLMVVYTKLGEASGERDWWRKALEVAERLNQAGQLSADDAGKIEVLRRMSNGEKR